MKRTRRFYLLAVLTLMLGLLTVSLAAADSGGPDGYGYTFEDSVEPTGPAFDWVDLSVSNTATFYALGDDESTPAHSLGFTFSFYGADFTSAYADSNGYISFEGGNGGDFSDSCFTGEVPYQVAGLWQDMDPGDDGNGIYAENFAAGSCPVNAYAGACTVFGYYGFDNFPGDGIPGGPNNLEMVLMDSGDIHIQYAIDGFDDVSTIGIADSTNAINLPYGCTAGTHDLGNTALLYTAPAPPEIVVSPSTLAAQHAAPGTTNDVLTIMNDGEATLNFDIVEQVPRNLPLQGDGIATKHATTVPEGYAPVAPGNLGGNAVADPSFEAGSPNPFWTEASTNFGSPLCTVGSCGTGTGTGPNTGSWWAWFGGIPAYEEGSVSQSVTIPSSATQLTFELEMIVCDSASDYLEVTIDGTQIWSMDGSSALCGQLGYTTQTADVSAYADGGAHTVAFHSEIFANNAGGSNFFVDDVAIEGPPDPGTCADGDWISWFDLDQWDGSLAGGASVNLNATFDSTGLTDGLHLGTLCIASNDPVNPLIEYPVRLSLNGPTDVSLTGFDGAADNGGLMVALGGLALVAFGVFVALRQRRRDVA